MNEARQVTTPELREQQSEPSYITVCAPRQVEGELQIVAIVLEAIRTLPDQDAQRRVINYVRARI